MARDDRLARLALQELVHLGNATCLAQALQLFSGAALGGAWPVLVAVHTSIAKKGLL